MFAVRNNLPQAFTFAYLPVPAQAWQWQSWEVMTDGMVSRIIPPHF